MSKGRSNIERIINELLVAIGDNPKREGLLRTPSRVAKSWEFLCNGYKQELDSIINNAIFSEDYDEMVTIKDIDFYSLCEHHLLPFFGKVQVAYIPDGKIIGLSKIPRIVDLFSRRLQVQERLTTEIADALENVLKPRGVIVVVEAEHLCMSMRGVQKPGSQTLTSAVRGVLRDDMSSRMEALRMIGKS